MPTSNTDRVVPSTWMDGSEPEGEHGDVGHHGCPVAPNGGGVRTHGEDSMTSDSHIEEPALRGRRAQAYRRGSPNGSKAVAVDRDLLNGAAAAGAAKSNGTAASNGASRPKILHVLEAVGGNPPPHRGCHPDRAPCRAPRGHPPRPPSAGRNGTSAIAMAAQRIVDSGAAIHRVSMVRNPLHPKIATGVVALRRLIAKLQPSVVHGHSSVGGAFAPPPPGANGFPSSTPPTGWRRIGPS